MKTILETLETPVRESVDVIVAGGGFAGVAAALAARRAGAEVLLLEKTALFGGLGTNGLINWYEPLCDGRGEQLICGISEELLRLSIRYGDDTLPEIWRDRARPVDKSLVSPMKSDPIGGRYATFFSPTQCQLALDEILTKEGIQIRLDITAVRPVKEGDRITGVVCESKSGREFFPALAFVDATGDADLFDRAGCACVNGRNYFSAVAHLSSTDGKTTALKNRQWLSCGSDLFGHGHPEGYPFLTGTTNEEVTRFLLDGRKAILGKIREKDRKSVDIASLPAQAQFRKTRRIVGVSTLTEDDRFVRQEDSIGLTADFDRPGDWYEIPFGTLISPDCANMTAAGRMISSDGWAWDVTRVIPVCALTGQAAGTAAALIAGSGESVRTLPVAKLQRMLADRGVRLHHD